MTWVPISHESRLGPVTGGSPEALVVLFGDPGASAAQLTSVAARWAPAVPTTAFLVLEGSEQGSEQADGPLAPSTRDRVASAQALDRAARHLGPLLKQELRLRRIDAARLVLVGFGSGGTVALHMVLCRGLTCAGVLAFTAQFTRPLPRLLRIDRKVRLIECMADRSDGDSRLRDAVASLTTRGIDARGVSLAGSALSDEAIRHGGAYLVELVATAQRGNRFHIERESAYGE